MGKTPDNLDSDRLNQLVRTMNERNGQVQPPPGMLPMHFKPRPSGWVCPKCGQSAEQVAIPAPASILGYAWAELPDGRPKPISVGTAEVVEHNPDGTPKRVYETIHCLNCFNAWQSRKMMEDTRANVPQLEYRGADNAAGQG